MGNLLPIAGVAFIAVVMVIVSLLLVAVIRLGNNVTHAPARVGDFTCVTR